MSNFNSNEKMKKIYYNFASKIAAVALTAAVVACSAEDDMTPPLENDDSRSTITLNASMAEGTRTSLNSLAEHMLIWTNNNEYSRMGLGVLRVSSVGGETSFCLKGSGCTEMSEDNRSASFSFTSKNEIRSLLRAYYPYVYEAELYSNAYYSETERLGSVVPVTIPSVQKQITAVAADKTGVTNGYDILPMVSGPLTIDEKTSFEGMEATVKAKMHVLSSIIAFFVYDSSGTYAAETVEEIDLQVDNGYVSGSTNVDLANLGQTEIPALVGTQNKASVTLNPSAKIVLSGVTSKQLSQPIYLSVVPGDYVGKITVKTDAAYYVFPFSKTKHFERAEVKDLLLNLSNEKVQRTAISEIVTPDITVTNLARSYSSNVQTATITVKKLNDAVVGFYALFKGQETVSRLTATEVISKGDVYRFGEPDNDLFTLQSDGTVNYKKAVTKAGGTFAFAVVPFGSFGNTGDVKGQRFFVYFNESNLHKFRTC